MFIRKYGTNQLTADKQIESGGIHPFYEVLYIFEGEVELLWMGQIFRSVSPCLFLLTPNTPHTFNKISTSYMYQYVEIDILSTDIFPCIEDVMHWNLLQGRLDWEAELPRMIQGTLHSIVTTMESINDCDLKFAFELISLDFKKIFLLINRFLSIQKNASSHGNLPAYNSFAAKETLVHTVMRLLESEYTNNLTLKKLADYVHLNPSYLDRVFKDVCGKTPFQYLQELRLNAAKSYLLTTQMTVQDISEAIGFQSIYYFSKLFKEKFEKSPTKWRNDHLQTIKKV